MILLRNKTVDISGKIWYNIYKELKNNQENYENTD